MDNLIIMNNENSKKDIDIEDIENIDTLINLSDECIEKTLNRIKNINALRDELIRLNLNPEGLIYFNNEVYPLLYTLTNLSTTSLNLSTSANVLSTAIYLKPKDSKIKDTLKLIYEITEQCEDIYDSLKYKIDTLICISKKSK
ncbi:hypothetical protein B2H94_07000 [Clostridium sporogenes]|uniref:Uncharacterized protein n=3 Tax=Clostridium TaxID=1485 RepID=A0AAE4Z5N4_CLOSG|nr:hypothetical protein [Clostridium sporogenes]AVQ40165.1 hypothetical protein C7M56_16330 [Clostridium botulinum]EDU37064.1 hypothetical protein CLOSPO_03233 [Clostridium sporogenes ATCC 15579]MBE6076121.1 hypothetical protein [Clostridium lundense]MCW7999352.1 hypothetical protein [Clostridium sp. cpc1]AVQ46407.1 hypothetical protein C7M60_11740 [Clostridium botulinum]